MNVFNYAHIHTYNGEGNGSPLQYSCLENPMDGEAWKAAVRGVTKSQTRLSDFTFTFHFHALEKEMATHSSVLAWRIPGTGEPGGLPSMGSQRVGHDWVTELNWTEWHSKPLVESSFLTRDQALSLWSGSTDSKTLDYQRTNPREYQIVRTHTKETTWIQDPASPNHQ